MKWSRPIVVGIFAILVLTSLSSCKPNLDKDLYGNVYAGNEAEVERLLRSGADPNYISPTADQFTPLIVAVKTRDEDLVALLLHYGANPNQHDKFGHSPLYFALLDNDEPVLILRLLIANGAKTNSQDVLPFYPFSPNDPKGDAFETNSGRIK